MGLFTPKNPPNTISDEDWDDIRRRANAEQTRRGGMFSKKAVEQRKSSNQQIKRKGAN